MPFQELQTCAQDPSTRERCLLDAQSSQFPPATRNAVFGKIRRNSMCLRQVFVMFRRFMDIFLPEKAKLRHRCSTHIKPNRVNITNNNICDQSKNRSLDPFETISKTNRLASSLSSLFASLLHIARHGEVMGGPSVILSPICLSCWRPSLLGCLPSLLGGHRY